MKDGKFEPEEITPWLIDSLQTERGGWTRADLAKLGVEWPPPRGWKKRLIADWQKRMTDIGFIK